MLVGVLAGIVAGVFVVTNWVGSLNYSTLYSNLDPSEAGEIVNYLTEQNVSYKLSEGGTTISVPSGDVYRLRISLASQGMPRSGNIGYSIFDQSNLGMTRIPAESEFPEGPRRRINAYDNAVVGRSGRTRAYRYAQRETI